ncbi:alpha/beta hydrolase [Umboniibacter marinipuniceus]|uniref:Acetyl esterase/lipase n=1 Tax=Umboniibacter marinipuniceus TaxID=569599 RepID=A0A3M0ACJ6_9GAMM|nr:alpha/beta hydrolase [Umboniibacter marinipuniceus]RMA82660.1 acetyl esterase/lipase [Umboniibacter marinipuniceus]
MVLELVRDLFTGLLSNSLLRGVVVTGVVVFEVGTVYAQPEEHNLTNVEPKTTYAAFTEPLWPAEMPLALTAANTEYEADCFGVQCAYEVSVPTLSFYPAKGENTGISLIILPGGGYTVEAIYHEGHEVAEFFSRHGINTAVLKYRIPSPTHSHTPWEVPLADARQGLLRLHELASEYELNPDAIGVIGFSAGSHLATWLSLEESEQLAHNPDFALLIYGVTQMNEENTRWLEESLFHRKMTAAEVREFSFLDRVTPSAPPSFLVHAMDDDVCHYHESTRYLSALTQQGVKAEMHLFQQGGHGFGLGRQEDGSHQWPALAVEWLRQFSRPMD